jgi:TIR- and PNP-associating SLOG family
MNLHGRRIQISGSASSSSDLDLIRYAHATVQEIVTRILVEGGGLILGVGRDPRDSRATDLSLIFDWTALECAAKYIRNGACKWPTSAGSPIVVVASENALDEIPGDRRALWNELTGSGAARLELIMPGARSGALLRDRQSDFGDLLVAVGGGTGVEHLATLYINSRRPLFPWACQSVRAAMTGPGAHTAYFAKRRRIQIVF